VDVPPKRAAIDLDELGDKPLSEISAAEFLQALEQAEALGAPVAAEDVTVKDALAGARAAFRLPFGGGLPEKKKVEREKFPLEKAPEKLFEGFPEKKKVELEKQQLEKAPEKLFEGFPEKKKVELEKPPLERPAEPGGALDELSARLTKIEDQLSRRSQ
jgi:hypothetical protein